MPTQNMPYDEQTEIAILTTYITFDNVRAQIEKELKPTDFFVPAHATLWGYIYNYITIRNNTFEYLPFHHFIHEEQKKDKALKKYDIDNLIYDLPPISTSAGTNHFLSHLKDLSKRREIIQKCSQIIEICQSKYDAAEIGDLIKDFDIVMESANKRNMAQEFGQWIDSTEGWFTVTNCDKELQIVTNKDRQNRRAILSRMVKSQLIERDINREGFYRRVDKDCEEIDLLHADDTPLPVKWVFGLEQYVNTYPKTISVISGSYNAGKTALMLNIAKMNRRNFDVHYFSSEMDATELKSRLVEFEDVDLSEFAHMHFWDRARNFADVIKPDGLNLIDYFEIDDNFFRINKQLADIRNKLKNGIAIIALQKDANKELGRGGSFSAEKARLYMTVDPDFPGAKIKVVKGKNWAHKNINPNGLTMKFKLYRGINLLPQGTWSLD